MAEKQTAEKKQTTKRTKKQQAPAAEPVATKVENTVETKPEKVVEPITQDTRVEVASCVHGELQWISKRNGYKITWGAFGDRNVLTVAELFEMRNNDRAFFSKNWVTVEDPRADEILKLLNVSEYYKQIRSVADFDDLILRTPPEKIEDIIVTLSYNTKENIARRAHELRANGILDSDRAIRAIFKATGFEDED